MGERKFRKFSVHGTGGFQLAAIEKEGASFEGAEIESFLGDSVVQRPKVEPVLDARQRQVR